MNITHINLNIGDFLGGVMQMDSAQIGAYTMLIIAHYQTGVIGLPDDDATLRLISRSNPKVWKRIKEKVLSKFTLKDGYWTQEKVIEKLSEMQARAGSGRRKVAEGIPKSFEQKSFKESQVENKSLKNNGSQKTILNPKSSIQEKEKNKKEKDFEDFWKACPRKVGKGKAREKYLIARKQEPAEFLLQAMQAHAKEMKGKDEEFIPHPATWLYQERYFDETKTTVMIQEKRDWPEWKEKIAAELGDHVVKSWFNTARKVYQDIEFEKKFEFDHVKTHFSGSLNKMGINEIRLRIKS